MEALNPARPPVLDNVRSFIKNGDTYLVQKENLTALVLSIVLLTTVLTTREVIPKSDVSNNLVCAFNSTPARLGFISLILFYAKAKPTTAVLLSAIFLAIVHQYHQIKTAESFAVVQYGSATSTTPACSNVTMQNLLDMTNGDATTIMRLAHQCGLPYGVVLNDVNAPLIATVLMSSGFAITPTCSPMNYDAGEDRRIIQENIVDTNLVETGKVVNAELWPLLE